MFNIIGRTIAPSAAELAERRRLSDLFNGLPRPKDGLPRMQIMQLHKAGYDECAIAKALDITARQALAVIRNAHQG